MKIYLDSIGCRLNQAEIEEMAVKFRAAGHEIVALPDGADLAVINTCTVTARAASDSRQKTRQVNRSGVGGIVLTGCWSTVEPGKAAAMENVSRIVPNESKDHLVSEILAEADPVFDLEPLARQPIPGSRKRTRAFIKVQDGCNNRCAFCITTVARGLGRSRQIPEVIRSIQSALQGGSQEVVLTGVHLGSWGKDLHKGERLGDLVQAILSQTDIPRLRLSSLEPWDLSASFFELWQDERMCRNLHLPLQSGSVITLKRMTRNVTPASFAALVSSARQAIPGVSITTDLIAGFPGETDQEFEETIDFVQQMQFSGGHVFTYSARPGTAASTFPNQVPHVVRKNRNAILRDILLNSQQEYARQFIDQELRVLWESASEMADGRWQLGGLADNYLHVTAESNDSRWNQVDRVMIKKLEETGLLGEIENLK